VTELALSEMEVGIEEKSIRNMMKICSEDVERSPA